ncbi:MAG: hypothetical protein ABR549_14380 [Mycobacteriales bacterium]
MTLPPTKEEVLAQWRARKRATRVAAEQGATLTETAIPAARASVEVLPDATAAQSGATTWTQTPIEVAPKLLSAGVAAVFVCAFALGESVALSLFA